MLLPYIKVNTEETYLDAQLTNDSIFYLPIGDNFMSQPSSINNETEILNDHNYHFNMMNEGSKCSTVNLFRSIAEENKL